MCFLFSFFFMFKQLHRLPLEFMILALDLKSNLGVAPKYLMDHIHHSSSATSHRPLRSSDWQIIFVPRVGTRGVVLKRVGGRNKGAVHKVRHARGGSEKV